MPMSARQVELVSHLLPARRWPSGGRSTGQLIGDCAAMPHVRIRRPAHAGEPAPLSPGAASLTMSSADNSPGTYLGSLEAGKIASNEIAPTIRNDARNARSLASSLIATALSTCSGVAEVAASTLVSSLLVTKSTP